MTIKNCKVPHLKSIDLNRIHSNYARLQHTSQTALLRYAGVAMQQLLPPVIVL